MSNLQGSSGDADGDNRPVDKSRGTGGWGEAEMNGESNGQHGSIYTMCVLNHCSRVWLFVTPRTVGHQAPLSMGFSRQEYWSELPCPPPEDLPYPGIEPIRSPVLPGRFFTLVPPGKPKHIHHHMWNRHWWKSALWLRELTLGLRNNLERWERVASGSEV